MTPALPDILMGQMISLVTPMPPEAGGDYLAGRMGLLAMLASLAAQEAERGEAPRYLIALTASVLKGERERCLADGMNDFLPKPIEQAALDQALSRFAVTASGTAPAS